LEFIVDRFTQTGNATPPFVGASSGWGTVCNLLG